MKIENAFADLGGFYNWDWSELVRNNPICQDGFYIGNMKELHERVPE